MFSSDEPFLPNVIKFFPFPECSPTAPTLRLDTKTPWKPHRDVAALQAHPSFVEDGALLYVHVPFCDFFCHYCPLYKTLDPGAYTAPEQNRYVANIGLEVAAYARKIAPGRSLKAIYLGGGTPTSLPNHLLKKIMACIRSEFEVVSGAEITFEGIPAHFADKERVLALRELGVNRISFGAQSLDLTVRKRLGRGDTPADCQSAIECARACGIDHVNVDMMYGYPGQTGEMFERDVLAIKALGPDSVDFYYYMQIMGTPYRQMTAKRRLPSSGDRILLSEMRSKLLDLCTDWHQVTTECFERNAHSVPRIWKNTFGGESGVAEVIAVGPSAYGQVAGHHYFNHGTLNTWQSALESGQLPLRGCLRLKGRPLALRVLFGAILLGRLPNHLVDRFQCHIGKPLSDWHKTGLLKKDNHGFTLTRSGQTRFQMLQCSLVPPLHAFIMMRTYMMTFAEQKSLLFKETDLLYSRSIAAMIVGPDKFFGAFRRLAYRILLLLPNPLLDALVRIVRSIVAFQLVR